MRLTRRGKIICYVLIPLTGLLLGVLSGPYYIYAAH
jgi:hypothetical protein